MIQDTVTKIEIDAEQKSNYSLNRITFKSGKIAFEKNIEGRSRFEENHCCAYKVTTEGYSGKPDWIEFIRDCETDKFDLGSSYMKNVIIVMQNVLTNAVTFHVNRDDRMDPLSEVEVLETAMIFAKGVLTGAQQIAKESLHDDN